MAKTESPERPAPPKRPANAYFIYQNRVRPDVTAKNPDMGVSDVAKLIGDMYKKLSEDEKTALNQEVEQRKKTYADEVKKYEDKYGEIKVERKQKKKRKVEDDSSEDEAPKKKKKPAVEEKAKDNTKGVKAKDGKADKKTVDNKAGSKNDDKKRSKSEDKKVEKKNTKTEPEKKDKAKAKK